MSRLRLIAGFVSTFSTFLLIGCFGGETTPPVAKTVGTVTYQGKPVAGATVTFNKEGAPRSGTGVTNAEGRFEISTFGNNDGALVGDNVVTVIKKAAGADASTKSAPKTQEEMMQAMKEYSAKAAETDKTKKTDELPERYSTTTTSTLKAIVSTDTSKNDFKFDLVD